MQTFNDSAARCDALGTLRNGLLGGAFWAIGSAWSVAVREVTLLVLPEDRIDTVMAEVLAAGITTIAGVSIALVVSLCKSPCNATRAAAPPPVTTTVHDKKRRQRPSSSAVRR